MSTFDARNATSAATNLLKVALTFGLVFNISLSAAPAFSSGRIAFLVMMVLYGEDAFALIVRFARRHRFFTALSLLLLPFTLLWLALNGTEDSVMFSRVFWFLVYSVSGAFLYVRMCRYDLSSAMSFYLLAMLIQSMFVFLSVFDPDFRNWVDSALVNAGNIDFTEGVRFAGLSNGGGAALSLQLSLGVVAALVLFTRSGSLLARLGFVLCALSITAATIFVGRTGLYVSVLAMLGFLMLPGRSLAVATLLITSICAAGAYMQSVAADGVDLAGNDVKLERTANWAFDVLLAGESTSASSLTMELPNTREMTITNLLLGSGRVEESDGENYARHDSGYLHSLYALGLPLSLLFYGALFAVFWGTLRPVHGELKAIGVMLVILVFIVEIKEPFIFKYTLPFFVLVYVYLARQVFTRKAR
jgi:hypothetical protein